LKSDIPRLKHRAALVTLNNVLARVRLFVIEMRDSAERLRGPLSVLVRGRGPRPIGRGKIG
jgi:hypothetical protein